MKRHARIADCGLRIADFSKVPIRNPKSEIRNLRGRAGFTLVELILVVIIIGVLATMVVPRLVGRTKEAKVARAKADLAAIGIALDLYELDTGRYPPSLDDLTKRDPPPDVERWNGPYLKKGKPKDPWSRDYVFDPDSKHNLDYDLSSLGPDGRPGSDDIANWE